MIRVSQQHTTHNTQHTFSVQPMNVLGHNLLISGSSSPLHFSKFGKVDDGGTSGAGHDVVASPEVVDLELVYSRNTRIGGERGGGG